MDLARLRGYVLGLILTTLAMSALFGAVFVFIREISLPYVILLLVAMLGVWGVNTYYVLKVVEAEEAGPSKPGEG